MDKKTYKKIKKIIVSCIIVSFIAYKSIVFFTTKDIEKDIVFYDLPKTNELSEDKSDNNTVNEPSADSTKSKDEETEIQNNLIDINSATSEQLQELYRIGPSLAGKIIEYRESFGYFETIEEIKEISGIGDATYEKIKDYITVNKNEKEEK